ncbi:MAG: hypothetical protein IRZ31_06250 [Thermogemmatispora sp.]|uniref:hypothetical protein n=1 Tax=Thermogemmatispora sp. TaxID=1968838 RepID=UPI0026195D89|nr:hypothetical protein [Thermogemmatispora sp.]MBX5456485.1 hypothetical protein [Thermogemmatispora sp.]
MGHSLVSGKIREVASLLGNRDASQSLYAGQMMIFRHQPKGLVSLDAPAPLSNALSLQIVRKVLKKQSLQRYREALYPGAATLPKTSIADLVAIVVPLMAILSGTDNRFSGQYLPLIQVNNCTPLSGCWR